MMEYNETKVFDKIKKHRKLSQKELYKVTMYQENSTRYAEEKKDT